MTPRVGIVGAGLAGTLLAWRLAGAHPDWSIELVGPRGGDPADATAVSGGLVRRFEADAESCRLASESLDELLASPDLLAWTGYEPTGSTYVCSGAESGAARAIADGRLADCATVVPASWLHEHAGWANLPAETIAVVEEQAGYISPARLRDELRARLGALGVSVVDADAAAIGVSAPAGCLPHTGLAGVSQSSDSGAAAACCLVGGNRREYDALVLATGSWTRQLLERSGLPANGYRTKAVQYALFETEGRRPTAFIDDTSGLYGRPAPDGGMLLGFPSERWNLSPDIRDASPADADRAAELAALRFPELRLTGRVRLAMATDCYAEPGRFALCPLPAGGLYTFTGGSGGSAKLALAASREAAAALATRVG